MTSSAQKGVGSNFGPNVKKPTSWPKRGVRTPWTPPPSPWIRHCIGLLLSILIILSYTTSKRSVYSMLYKQQINFLLPHNAGLATINTCITKVFSPNEMISNLCGDCGWAGHSWSSSTNNRDVWKLLFPQCCLCNIVGVIPTGKFRQWFIRIAVGILEYKS